jgi:hypothetical protein
MPFAPPPTEPEELPDVRDPRKAYGPAEQGKVIKKIRQGVRAHGTFEIACEAAGLPLAKLEEWIADNPHLEVTLIKDRADFKTQQAKDACDKDLSLATRKLALEVLSRLDKSWAPRTRTTLATQLQDFLDESKRVEPPEVFERIIARLSKYA